MARRLITALILLYSTSAFSEDCSNVIALSKERGKVVASESDVASYAATFCSEYQASQNQQGSAAFNVAYGFLQGGFSSGNASTSEVASKYCSSTNTQSASSNSYQQYIEQIAPGAYEAYQQCLKSKDKISFNIDESAILPNQFNMVVANIELGGQVAIIQTTSSDGVKCTWNNMTVSSVSIASGTNGGQKTLSCKRADPSHPAIVTLAQTNGTAYITIPWPAYTPEGVPINVIKSIEDSVVVVQGQLNRLSPTILKNRLFVYRDNNSLKCNTYIDAQKTNPTGDPWPQSKIRLQCPDGTARISGGCSFTCKGLEHTESIPDGDSGWVCGAIAHDDGNPPRTFQPYLLCLGP